MSSDAYRAKDCEFRKNQIQSVRNRTRVLASNIAIRAAVTKRNRRSAITLAKVGCYEPNKDR